jgi:hypothetical protein
MGVPMRSDMLERLRRTMRGASAQNAAVGVGTLEPVPFQPSVPTSSNMEFQHETPVVPTVPTVPTHEVRGKRESGISSESVSEPALEPSRNGLPATSLYDPEALQAGTDRRNAAAAREGITDRFCRCGHLATFAWPGDDGRDVWMCGECLPTRGRA